LQFGQATQVELAKSQFAFDPGVAESMTRLRRRYCFCASGVAIFWRKAIMGSVSSVVPVLSFSALPLRRLPT